VKQSENTKPRRARRSSVPRKPARKQNPKSPRSAKDIPEDWQLNRNVAHFFSRIIHRLNLNLQEVIRDLDITTQHFRVLQILYDQDGVTIGTLGKRIVIAQAVLSRVITQMEDRGLIERRPNSTDARYIDVFLTDRGASVYETAWLRARLVIDDALGDLSEQEIRTLLSLVEKIDNKLNQ
jgi:DNA-binding MarR family transcriptional regulator